MEGNFRRKGEREMIEGGVITNPRFTAATPCEEITCVMFEEWHYYARPPEVIGKTWFTRLGQSWWHIHWWHIIHGRTACLCCKYFKGLDLKKEKEEE